MKKLITGMLAAVLFGAAGAVVFDAGTGQAAAHQDDDRPAVAQTQNDGQPAGQNDGAVYRYVAQPGDSYTLMARKAVQTYGKKYEVALSPAGIIYAETNMTLEAGSPELAAAQQVEISEQTVKQWAEKARKLSGAQEAAWGYYAQFADFNTDSVGQSR